jgi:hypothetical protein
MQSRVGHDGDEAKWSGKRRKEALLLDAVV